MMDGARMACTCIDAVVRACTGISLSADPRASDFVMCVCACAYIHIYKDTYIHEYLKTCTFSPKRHNLLKHLSKEKASCACVCKPCVCPDSYTYAHLYLHI